MQMAYHAATRATCDRKHVGAVIVVERRVVATGYNGSPKWTPSCDEAGHEIYQEHCIRTLHAESNAIDWAGRATFGATLYVTVIPCYDCAKRIVNAGLVRVCYDEFYPSRYSKSDQVPAFFAENKVECIQLDTPGLHLYKELQAEMDKRLAEALKVTLVKFDCGCEVPYPAAGPMCIVHEAPQVTA